MRSFMFTSLLCLWSISTSVFAEEVPATEGTPSTETPSTPSPTDNGNAAEATETPEPTPDNTATENTTTENGNTETATENTPVPEAQPEAQAEATETPDPTPTTTEAAATESAADHFTVEQMWSQSSGPVRTVLGTLLFMLVAAMAVGLERFLTLGAARRQSRALAGQVGSMFGSGDLPQVLSTCANSDFEKSYLANMLKVGVKEFNDRPNHYGIEAVERALEKQSIGEVASLNKGLNILATVGSTAPFVGLVGTIFGIINAFGQIGAEGGADLTTLAPAIGEALITTAFGIIVAIVGVWLFNFFTATIESITNDMAESSQDLLDWCHKRIIPDESSK